MPRFTHYPWIQRLLGRGINKDIAPELVPDGLARDAFHVRPTSSSGATGAIEAVGGEQLLYPPPFANNTAYVCIGSAVINNRHVAFWASSNVGEDPCIVIDGVLVAQSPNIPYLFDRPLQIAPEERCKGGILYPVDGEHDPLYWDIDDLIEQSQLNTQVYFSEYTTEYNSVALSVPAEFPVFDGLFSAGTGLPVGQYVYSLRYVTPAGDRTNRSPETPMIGVPIFQDFNYATFYPGCRTTGGGDLGIPTQYGVRLRWRVDNSQGYESIEVCRQRFNDGQGMTNPGIYEVVARIPIDPNQFGILTFTDPGEWTLDPPEPIASDEAADQLVFPGAPKAVEIAENRLLYGNVKSTPQVIPLQFGTDANGNTVVPITQRLTTVDESGQEFNSGHNDPFNLAYYRSFARGEKYGFAIIPWDGNSAKLPAVPVAGADNYQFPNRRDVKGPLGPYGVKSLQYSTDAADAANTQVQSTEPVTPTFEVLTQGSLARPLQSGVTLSNVTPASTYPFVPMLPISPTSSNQSVSGWNFPPQFSRSGLPIPSALTQETGAVLAQRHHALGLLINEITGIPSNVKAITVGRSDPSGRVVASGFGFWDMRNGTPDEGLRAQRSSNALRCHFPEIDASLVDQSIFDDLIANPQNYRMQIVGSYGFYQDVFGYAPTSTPISGNAICADMLLHATVTNDPTGQVNVLAPSRAWTIGPNTSSPPGEYIGLGKWRNPVFYGQDSQLPFNTSPEQGNVLYDIQSISSVQEGRGRYFRIQTNQYIYTSDSQDTDGAIGLNSDEIRRFHQPVYAINIVRLNADVSQGQVPLYVNTATTIKTRSTIGVMPAVNPSVVEFELLGERLEDVRPYVIGQTVDDLRYVWIKSPGVEERAWLNVTNMSFPLIDIGQILSDISANGFWLSPDGTQVYGIYTVRSSPFIGIPGREFSSGVKHFIVFGDPNDPSVGLPPANSRIIVKFCGKNVRVFGGDRFISRQIFSPYDRAATVQTQNQCLLGLPPMPMWGIFRPPTYALPLSPGAANLSFAMFHIQSARQIAVLWDAETRINTNMDLFTPLTGMSFPRTNFISRPYSSVSSTSGAANGFFPQYDQLYQTELDGQNAASEFSYGGIPFPNRFPPINYDYSKQPNQTFAGLPAVGFSDEIDQCTAIYASNEYFPGSQDLPGLRTFLSSNVKYISNENGEIKVIASALSGAGRNIYAWTERGVVRILYNKSILVGASGEQISTQQVSNLWGDEMWITRNIGLPDQMWRNFVKGYAPTGQGYADSFFWMDRKGAYRMTGDNIIDISRDKILSDLAPTLLNYPTDYSGQFAGLYNVKDDEVWFYAGPQTLAPDPPLVPSPVVLAPRLFVYNARLGEWVGKFDFQYDNFVMRDRQILGNRQLETNALDVGDIVNGQTRVASVRVPFFGEVGKFKQHLRWRFVGAGDRMNAKPDEVRIYDAGGNLLCVQNFAIAFAANPAFANEWVLWYDGWEQHTASILASVDPQRRVPQSEGFFVELIWNTGGYKNLLSVSSQLQPIR